MEVYYIVKCPNCGRLLLYVPRTRDPRRWVKKCTYCGKIFLVNPKSDFSRIVKEFTDYQEARRYLEEKYKHYG